MDISTENINDMDNDLNPKFQKNTAILKSVN